MAIEPGPSFPKTSIPELTVICNLQKLLLKPNDSAIKALKIINEGDAQIALIVDSEDRLLGTLTDGDIRRGLLNGKSLEE